jgi:hypothetical protein
MSGYVARFDYPDDTKRSERKGKGPTTGETLTTATGGQQAVVHNPRQTFPRARRVAGVSRRPRSAGVRGCPVSPAPLV